MNPLIYNSPLVCFVYIIRGVTDYHYCGITSNLQKRLQQHNEGRTDYKTPHRPFEYVYVKRLFSRKEARYYEKAIKAFGVKRWYTRELLSNRIESSRQIIKALNLPDGIAGTGSPSEQGRTMPAMGS